VRGRERIIEIIRPNSAPGRVRIAVFDFDGTVSLLRHDWQRVMIELCVEMIPLHNGESPADLYRQAMEMVHHTNGQPTLAQMQWIADRVHERTGQPQSAHHYKTLFLERLLRTVTPRVQALQQGTTPPEAWQMPGVRALLESLRARAVPCYLASGTDEQPVCEETAALGLAPFFAGIYGATADYASSTKAAIFERIVKRHALRAGELVAFGDGVQEIRLCKEHAGIAVGLARDETRDGAIDPEQRARLIAAGADVIISDFRAHHAILDYLFPA